MVLFFCKDNILPVYIIITLSYFLSNHFVTIAVYIWQESGTTVYETANTMNDF